MNYTTLNKRQEMLVLLKDLYKVADALQFVSCELGGKIHNVGRELYNLIEKL